MAYPRPCVFLCRPYPRSRLVHFAYRNKGELIFHVTGERLEKPHAAVVCATYTMQQSP